LDWRYLRLTSTPDGPKWILVSITIRSLYLYLPDIVSFTSVFLVADG